MTGQEREALTGRMSEEAFVEARRQGLIRKPISASDERNLAAKVDAVVEAALAAREEPTTDEIVGREWTLRQDWSTPLLVAEGPMLTTDHHIGEGIVAEVVVVPKSSHRAREEPQDEGGPSETRQAQYDTILRLQDELAVERARAREDTERPDEAEIWRVQQLIVGDLRPSRKKDAREIAMAVLAVQDTERPEREPGRSGVRPGGEIPEQEHER